MFSVHLKASSGSANEAQRLAEVNVLRGVTNALPANSYFIVCGDFNIYGSDEPVYQRLLEQDGSNGFFIDPSGYQGTWNTPAYAAFHTQSPRVRSFGGGASGGLDDRFDLILFSYSFGPNGAMQYMYNTTWAVGNNGLTYNDSINSPNNAGISPTMTNALHYASDHLPVVTSFNVLNIASVQDQATELPITVKPNPSNGIYEVLARGHSPIIAWTVYDAAGREVLHGNPLATGQCSIDIAAQPAGVYLLKVYTENGMYDTRLLKY